MPRRHTLLVVDDEPDVVQSVQDLLRLDFRVLGATSAAEGMRLLEAQEVHIVMTDQRMPEMTGVEFLSKVRGEHPEAIRLLFTGYADIRAVIDAINQGNVFRYITKPWDPDELLTIIRQAAEQYDLLVERRRLLAELQTKNQELERNGRLKDAFIKVASHELRTPVTIVSGLAELALRSDLAPGVRSWLAGIQRAGIRLTHLTDQIVQMLLAGKFDRPLERKPTDLAALLHEAADDVQPFVQQRRQELTLDLADGLGSLAVDAAKLRDVLANLLFNAVKFTPDAGRIVLRARRAADGGAEIQVSDTGIGIDAASLQHVFDPFFTAFDVSRHSSGQFEFGRRGLGLGLTLVRAFVELHGGRVTVESKPHQGTTFTVTLPAAEETNHA